MIHKREADFAGFLGETIHILSETWRFVIVYCALVGGLNALGIYMGWIEAYSDFTGFRFGAVSDPDGGVIAAVYIFAVIIFAVIASYLLLAKYLEAQGRLSNGGNRILAYAGMVIVSLLGTVFATLLFIIPGLIVLVRWSASSGFLIGKGQGVIESLGASWDATRGYSWQIFFAGLVIAIGFGVMSGIVGALAGLVSGGTIDVISIVASVMDTLSSALFYAYGIAIYTLVHDDNDELGEVFS